jgi:hypothetical protein
MHPLTLQQLAADHVNDMIAAAAGSRRARQARRTRRSRTSRLRTQLGLPRSQAELQPAASPAPARLGRRRALIAIRRFRWNPPARIAAADRSAGSCRLRRAIHNPAPEVRHVPTPAPMPAG